LLAHCFYVQQPWDPYSHVFAQDEQAFPAIPDGIHCGEYYTVAGDDARLLHIRATSSTNGQSTVDANTLAW